jgi:uncharacterized membrane protein YoaK (UPF0700 family)
MLTRNWHLLFGLLLTALAGYVDALGFVRLGGFYASFMSGNTTQIGVTLGHGASSPAIIPLALIGMFLAGATLGSALSIAAPLGWQTPVVLGAEALFVSAALAAGLQMPDSVLTSALMALAMGAQNAVLGSGTVKGFRAGTTFVTGALFGFGQKLAAALMRTGEPYGWVGDATVWLALMGGALCGAAVYQAIEIYALILPAALAGLLALIASLFVARRPQRLGQQASDR